MACVPRTSVVRSLKVNDTGYGSAIFVGDLVDFSPVSYVYAVQREIPVFYGDEGNLSAYPIYSASLPKARQEPAVQMDVTNTCPFICAGDVRVEAISTASMVQFGSVRTIRADTRVKNIRQLLRGLPPK
ncbi:spore germination protein GerPE [Paenibacillus ehimensis]|uniref:Spore germination protein GerPE n=1 Tax=Paenibacillus ehimensis TaxID=79264 RepID=A0ABT8VAR7_9BACL|nr:spore germination protein GerPE [Paenibacillus ehimensis]MDO3678072.1 spore germination protein GerPE [Paenibacillus ehimensis]MEC0210534.1 spore germination protein GerPE [Paenibacillus ehimensis]